jgi:hypothetical protein
MADVKPGQWVTITVKSQPRTEGGRKTLARLLQKDPKARKERARLKRSRVREQHSRGGRMWNDNPPAIKVVQVKPGASSRVFASIDVLKDVASVAKYVEVAPAK